MWLLLKRNVVIIIYVGWLGTSSVTLAIRKCEFNWNLSDEFLVKNYISTVGKINLLTKAWLPFLLSMDFIYYNMIVSIQQFRSRTLRI